MAEEQEIMDAPEIGEGQDNQEGPGPKSVLSEDNRKKLDGIVQKMIDNKEPEENIKKVVDDFKTKYSVAIPKLSPNIPQQKPLSEATNIPRPTPKMLPGTTADHLKAVQDKAAQHLNAEFQSNQDIIPDIIHKQKARAAEQQRLLQYSQQPKTDQPLTAAQQSAQQLAAPVPQVQITPEDVQAFQQNLQNNEQAARGFLHNIADKKPDKAKQIQVSLYVADAANREQNASKILHNAQQIEKGKLTYNIQGGHLMKPEDAWESIATGLQEKNKGFADYSLFTSLAPEDAIKELEKRRAEYDPDEPTPVPKGFVSELTGGMAAQPLKGLLAGKAVGAATAMVPGAEEFAPATDKFVSAAVSGNDFRKLSYANALQKYYNQLRNEGMSPEDAYKQANGQAKDESAVDAISGAAMMYMGGKIGEMPIPKFSLAQGYKTALKSALKQVATGVGEAGAVGLIQGAAQDAKNKLADMKGIQHDTSGEDIAHSMESGALFTLGLAAIAKGTGALSKGVKTQVLEGLSKATPEQINQELGNQILQGHITPDEAQTAAKEIEEHKMLATSIPDNVTDESRAKIYDKIKRRDDLELQLESADKAFHTEIKEKIKAINDDILELSRDKKPKEVSQNETNVSRGNINENDNITENEGFLESRHANTKDDEQGKVSGPNDNVLSAEGKKDANSLAEEVKDKGVTKIITSDLERAKETGHIVSEKTGAKTESRPELNTWDIGDFDKASDEEFKKAQEYFVTHPDEKEFEGKHINESFNEYKDRVIKARTELENEPPSTLVVNHSNNMMLWDAYEKNGRQWNEKAAQDYLNAKTPEPATLVKKENSIQPGDTVVSPHFEGPQKVRSVSQDGKTVYVEGAQDHHVHEIPIDDITLKIKQNARSVRKNPRQIQEGGDTAEGSEETRGNDISASSEPASGDGETEQQEGGKVGSIPPNMHDLPFEPEPQDVTRLAHADTEKIYEEMGISRRVPRPTKDDVKLESEADDLIKKGYDFVGKAHRVLDTDEGFTDTEQVAFSKMVGALKAKLNHMDISDPEFDRLQDMRELLSRASDKVGSEEGAAFRARRLFVLNDESLSDYIQQEKDALGVDELTDQQKADVKAQYDDIKQKQADYEAKIKDLEEENAKLKAQNEIKKSGSKKGVSKKSHADYVKERKDILADMRADLLKVAKGEGGLTASVPGVAQLTAIAPHVGKLMKSLLEEGIDKLEDVVKSIHSDLKDILPGITEKDVHDIIAGEYNPKKATKNELAAKARDLKDEAALLNRLGQLQRGEEPKNEKKKVERNKQITNLKKQIADIIRTRRKDEKEANTFYTEPKTETRQRLESMINRNKKELKEVQEKIAKGDFGPDEKKVPLLDNPEVREKYPNLYKDAVKARDALNKAKSDREIGLLKQQYANRPKVQKLIDTGAEVLNTPRALMSSMDFSAPLRQGIWGVTKQLFDSKGRKDLGSQFVTMFKMAGSQKVFDRWFADLKEAPDYEIMQKVGLPLSDPHDPKLTAKEEAFMSNFAEKLPLGIGKLIKGSERAYVGFLNKMRVDIFRRAQDAFLADGKTFDNSPELYQAMADYVGAATGRGKMPEVMEKSAPILNAMFFSPRLIASRLNLLTNWANPKFYSKVPREVRVQYFKDMAKFIGLGTMVLGLAKMGGADVEDDPRSSDFGKIKVGNTRWDIWGGFQQYVRLAAQLITGEKKSTTSGNIKELTGEGQFGQTRADVLFQFLRGKLAPVPAETIDILKGTDVTGQPATFTSEASKNLPLVLGDIKTAYDDGGIGSALGVGIPSMFGVGVQTYQSKGGGSGGGGGASEQYIITPGR